jgi:hypothetical protein
VSDQASVIVLCKLGNDERRRERERERERGKSIAVSHYHHRRSFACLASTSLLNSIFLTANMRLIVNARTIFFSKIFLKGLI